MKKLLLNITIFFAIWQVANWLNFFPNNLPSIISVAKAFLNLAEMTEMTIAMFVTLKYVLFSLLLGVFVGYSLGVFLGVTPSVRSFFYGYLNGIKAIPVTILLPLFLAVFGFNNFPIPIIAVPITAIIAVNIAEACDKINSNRQSLAKLLEISKFNYWLHVLRWETLDILFASLRIVITYALALQIAFEYFLNHLKGIGCYISVVYSGSADNRLGNMYAAILLIALVGIGSIKILDIISQKQLKWKTQI